MQHDPYLPISLNLKDRACLVLGGGPIALAKLRPLVEAGSTVLLAAHNPIKEIADLLDNNKVIQASLPFGSRDFEGILLAIDSGEEPAHSQSLRSLAKTNNILLNTVDQPEFCDYFTPAVVRRGPLKIAFSTGGAAPALARNLRQKLERLLPHRLGELVESARKWRPEVQRRLSPTAQKEFWNRLFADTSLQNICDEGTHIDDCIEHLISSQSTSVEAKGKVWLVGAGSGNADTITLQALKLLEAADVVLHDALLDPTLLEYARRDARLIAVGKRCGKASTTQTFINKSLANFAEQGHRVVRLKCGDPFIFGRGGEELKYLQARQVPVEVVAGVTTAAQAAAEELVPLTYRGKARRITFMTGATSKSLPEDRPQWKALLDGGTVAIYMARLGLQENMDSMIEAGLAPDMPAMLVAGLGSSERVSIKATISTLAIQSANVPNHLPTLVLVGDALAECASQNEFAPCPAESSSLRQWA
ncbi:MAG: uroporphyrinogen-III C-methyltransferase [Kordiimonadaceae bacterium]|nr:uroporphyrinogen-III C-methyltransferase [Kordiimonadaceae bacterium]MBO6567504.1 uroporphyrinogen-III C-methyltransferase [Kordiimonadaceae bacterium]MBO6963282.1 uroporphyrinogen-III C-methyltransferase [Kordiimonadaceae bacterium]